VNARRAALVVVMLLLATACGTRLSDRSIEAAAYGPRGQAATEAAGPAASGPATGPGNAADGAASTGEAAAAPTATGGATHTAAATCAGATAATGEPIRIGQIGTFSGIIGAGGVGFKQTAQAWVAAINAKGGINGHPVKFVSADDGADGAKGLSEVKDMVENQHVIAFVSTMLLSSGTSVRAYLEQHHIPVIGGDVYDGFWHESPVLFPQSEFINNLHYATAASVVQAGHKSFALMWCAEVAACGAARPHWESSIKKLGGRVAYAAQVSLAAPDYTAQCVQAEQSGADVVWVGADPSTIKRIANSCARQGYHPSFTGAAGSLAVDFADNPSLDGFHGASQVFPWFMTSGSPAFQEYGEVMKRYAPSAQLQPSTAQSWVAMKLFEKVASATIAAGQTPTTDALFRGLWAIRNETLSGLTSPLTFVANKPAVKGDCSYLVAVQGGRWVAPSGLQLTCGTP